MRYTVPAKKGKSPGYKTGPNLTVIIPAAGIGRRMKSYAPKCLIKIHNEKLIERQIRIINDIYPNSEIIVTIGYKANKIYSNLPQDVRAVENVLYESTNVAHSIGLGLRAATTDNVLIIYGDLVFNHNAIDNITENKSQVITDNNDLMDDDEVGLVIENNVVKHFSFGLNKKWSHIAYFTDKELSVFRQLTWNKENRKLYTFEIMNKMIDCGCNISSFIPEKGKVIEIDNSKDITKANENCMS